MKGNSMVEVIAQHAKATPDKTALIDATSRCTYAELWRYIKSFSRRLRQAGLAEGDRVLVRSQQTITYLVAAFGVHLAGGVLVPVEKNVADGRILELMSYAEATMLIAVKQVECDCIYINLDTACSDVQEVSDDEVSFPPPEQMSDILFTTGTSGKSKGVMLNFESQVATAENVTYQMEAVPEDIMMVPMPLNHAGGARRTNGFLYLGATVVLHNGVIFIKPFFDAMEEHGVTIVYLVPAYMEMLLGAAPDLFRRFNKQLRAVCAGSAATSLKQRRLFKKILPDVTLYITYGASEAGNACFFPASRFPDKPGCIGYVTKNTILTFSDEDGNTLEKTSEKEPGIVTIEGKTVMMGYWKDKALTDTVLHNGKLLMADVGYKGEDGLIYLLGRKDDVIVTGGNKVAPFEIEDIVQAMPGVKECACVPVADEIMGSVPKLYVVMKEGHEYSQKDIFTLLSSKLEYFKVPKYIEQIDELPRTSTGKLQKAKLAERPAQ